MPPLRRQIIRRRYFRHYFRRLRHISYAAFSAFAFRQLFAAAIFDMPLMISFSLLILFSRYFRLLRRRRRDMATKQSYGAMVIERYCRRQARARSASREAFH